MDIWTYDRETGALIGQETADPNPLEPGAFLIPANATGVPPPAAPAGQVATWDGQAWALAPLPSETPEALAARHAGTIMEAKYSVTVFADQLADLITGPVPRSEKDGWDAKARAAAVYNAARDLGEDHSTAYGKADPIGRILIDAEIGATGEDWLAISQKIIAQATFYALASGKIAAIRRNTMAAIEALGATPTQSALDQVLASAKATAEAEFASVMAQAPA